MYDPRHQRASETSHVDQGSSRIATRANGIRSTFSIVEEIVATTGATLGFAGAREPSPRRPAIVDTIAAVIIAALALAVLLCLAAISPVVWTFASDTASRLRSELSQCLSVEDGGTRLACYDEIAHRPPPHPAKGADAPAAAFGRSDHAP